MRLWRAFVRLPAMDGRREGMRVFRKPGCGGASHGHGFSADSTNAAEPAKRRSHFSKGTDTGFCAPCFLQSLHRTWFCLCFGACGSRGWPAQADISSLVSMPDRTGRCLPDRTDGKGNQIRQAQDTFSDRWRKSRRRPRTPGCFLLTARPVRCRHATNKKIHVRTGLASCRFLLACEDRKEKKFAT